MRQYFGVITPILAALVVITGSITACSHLEQTHEQSIEETAPNQTTPVNHSSQALQALFQRVQTGDTLQTVTDRLGPPALEHSAPNNQRVLQYERVQIIQGAAVVTFNGFITLNNNDVVTQVQQTKP